MKKTHNYRVHYSAAIKSFGAENEDLCIPREIDIYEELERQIEREKKSAAENPASYRLADIMNSASGDNYRSGRDAGNPYMTHDDFMRLIVAETKIGSYGKNNTCVQRSECRPAAPYHVRQAVKAGADGSYESVINGDQCYSLKLEPSATTFSGFVSGVVDKWFPITTVLKPDRKVRRRMASSAAGIAWVMIFVLVLALPIALGVLKSEAAGELTDMRRELAALEAEEARLSAEFESSIDLREVENIAVNEYGMIKLDQSTIRVLRINGTDSIESFSGSRSNSLVPALLSALGIRSGNE